MNTQERNRNPYQNIDWEKQIRVTGCTHVHCSTRKEFIHAMESGLEFATFATYYPSAPYYPASSIRENTFKLVTEDGNVNDVMLVPANILSPSA